MTKNQKSALCGFLRALVKKSPELSVQEILDKFLEDERYYLEINASRFEFLADVIDDDQFLNDTELFLKECRKYYDYKKKQEPIIQAQKEFEKKKRKCNVRIATTRDVVSAFVYLYMLNPPRGHCQCPGMICETC